MKRAYAAALVLSAASSAFAQQGQAVSWDFSGITSTAFTQSVPASAAVPSGASALLPGVAANLSRGPGLAAAFVANGRLSSTGIATGVSIVTSNNDYYQFAYTAPAAGGVRLFTAQGQYQRTGSSTVLQYRWYRSTDGGTTFTPFSSQASLSNTNTGTQGFGSPILDQRLNNGESAIYRLYFVGSAGNVGIAALTLRAYGSYANSVDRTWDMLAAPASFSVDAGAYSSFSLATLQTSFPDATDHAGTFLISGQSGPTTLVEGTDFTFDATSRVLTMLNTGNIAAGTYAFSYSVAESFVQNGSPVSQLADTGTISITVVPTPGTAAIAAMGLTFAVRRRR